MDLHSLQPSEGSKHRRIRVGRGRASGKGKTAGRGHKGQMSRAGATHKPLFEGGQMPLVRKLPKRGFTNFNRKEILPVNLDALAAFEEGSEVTIELLIEKGLVNGRFDGVKILGNGSVDKKLVVKANAFSASAKEKIEAAGGSCEIV
ncbi:50S ribosomal protein L15 [Pontiella sulfatireligans]|uniref:Large ribosomal subunit protein uL15 n=1 Tax=Pontiella sulfatireligans TaxID=2750658 RepID=A0A6C2UMJ8_9BACT|nr:50S ribosomal protein L15 [Pontiella sulfatireligans]VGO20534.1 50S ribosomal protein L15 [Pontiella sulfatireligans]